MTVPQNARDFVQRLQARSEDELEQLVDAELLDGIPHIFRGDAAQLRAFRAHIAHALGAPAADIYIVGSAHLGFSLNPHHYFRPLLAHSDLDLIVIHSGLFDFAWHTLLKWHYRILGKDVDGDSRWASKRRRELWKGWFEPHRWHLQPRRAVARSVPEALKPAREFATTWFTTFTSLGRYRHTEIARRRASARLYRTATHVRLYHANGLRALRHHLSRHR